MNTPQTHTQTVRITLTPEQWEGVRVGAAKANVSRERFLSAYIRVALDHPKLLALAHYEKELEAVRNAA